MKKGNAFFDSQFELSPENKEFAKKYDAEQGVFREVNISADPQFSEIAHNARQQYEALKKAQKEYKKIVDGLENSCKKQFQDWVKNQGDMPSPPSTPKGQTKV